MFKKFWKNSELGPFLMLTGEGQKIIHEGNVRKLHNTKNGILDPLTPSVTTFEWFFVPKTIQCNKILETPPPKALRNFQTIPNEKKSFLK